MAIDIFNDELIPVRDAAKLFPGGGCCQASLNRYYNHGIKGVLLETVRSGGRVYTTKRAIEEFCKATTAAAAPVKSTIDLRRASVAFQIRQAESRAYLRANGIGNDELNAQIKEARKLAKERKAQQA